jgi:hypothetical protein
VQQGEGATERWVERNKERDNDDRWDPMAGGANCSVRGRMEINKWAKPKN